MKEQQIKSGEQGLSNHYFREIQTAMIIRKKEDGDTPSAMWQT